MAKKITPNKLNDRDRRRVENVRERLRAQGVGEDEATRRAIEEVTAGHHSGTGGGSHGAGEARKTTRIGGRRRTGSHSNASK